MSKKENTKSRTESSSEEAGKTSHSRSGSLQNLQLENTSEAVKDDDSPQRSSFRAIKPRLLANMAHKVSAPSRSVSSRKSSGQPSKRGSTQIQPANEANSPSAAEVESVKQVPQAIPTAEDPSKADLTALENEKLRNRLEFILRKNKQLEEEKEKISQDREESMKNIENLLSQNRELTSENTTMKEQRQRDSRMIDELQKQTTSQEQRIQKLKDENRMLNESNLKTMRELQTVSQEKSDLSKSCKTQHAELKKLVADKQKDTIRLDQAEQRYTKLRTDYQAAIKQTEQLRAELKKHKDSMEELKAENKRLKMSSTAIATRDDVSSKIKSGPSRGAAKK